MHVRLLKMLANNSNNSCSLESMGKPFGQENHVQIPTTCSAKMICALTLPLRLQAWTI